MQKLGPINEMDAMKMSMQCEMDMKKFYNEAAALVKNDDALAILRGLESKKEKHRQDLFKLYRQASGKKILYLNLGKKHKLNSLQEYGSDPNEAIDIAKKNENELKSFYLLISRRLLNPKLRHFFRELVLEEEQYLALLESSFMEPLALDEKTAAAQVVPMF